MDVNLMTKSTFCFLIKSYNVTLLCPVGESADSGIFPYRNGTVFTFFQSKACQKYVQTFRFPDGSAQALP